MENELGFCISHRTNQSHLILKLDELILDWVQADRGQFTN
jgi:hypothetical protein